MGKTALLNDEMLNTSFGRFFLFIEINPSSYFNDKIRARTVIHTTR